MALDRKIAVLIGGVGGAKLARGLVDVAPKPQLSFIVNTGDDFWRYGLKICPDLDTVMYTLAGLVDAHSGWGVENDTSATMDSLTRLYGVDSWFRLGDQDLATHLLRTDLLRQGLSLTEVTRSLTEQLGIQARLLPMSDADVPTIVDTVEAGELPFQEYFVKRAWQPTLRSIRYGQADTAALAEPARVALLEADLVLIAPSNPWLSIAPILSLPRLRCLLGGLTAPVVAVTPIIAGDAVKGPTAKIMRELGLEVSPAAVASFYDGIISGFVNDIRNEPLALPGLASLQTDTLMTDLAAKTALSKAILAWVDEVQP